jgi:hypothetical protein
MMLWKTKTLTEALLHDRQKTMSEDAVINAVKSILAQADEERQIIKDALDTNNPSDSNAFVFDLLESDKIFHVSQIKNICIAYRLRFLGSHLFKSKVPEEAVSKIKSLEKSHNTAFTGFMIVAPSKQFHLESYDDPLLFAPIGNGYYYLIHKWGNDLSRFRKIAILPLRDFGNLLGFLAIASIIFAGVITKLLFTGTDTDVFLLIAFLFTFKSFCGIALYYCFWKGKNFNASIWDSPYYNR